MKQLIKHCIAILLLLLLAIPAAAQKDGSINEDDASWQRVKLAAGKYVFSDIGSDSIRGTENVVAIDLGKSKPDNCFSNFTDSKQFPSLGAPSGPRMIHMMTIEPLKNSNVQPSFELNRDCNIRIKLAKTAAQVLADARNSGSHTDEAIAAADPDYIFRREGSGSTARIYFHFGDKRLAHRLAPGSYNLKMLRNSGSGDSWSGWFKVDLSKSDSCKVHNRRISSELVPPHLKGPQIELDGATGFDFTVTRDCNLYIKNTHHNAASHNFYAQFLKK